MFVETNSNRFSPKKLLVFFSIVLVAAKASPICSDGYCQLSNNSCVLCSSVSGPEVCVNLNSNCRRRRHRSMMMVVNDEEDSGRFFRSQVMDRCGAYAYTGYLHVDTHLYAVAMPSKDARAANCPFLAVHAVLQEGKDPQKEILLWEDVEEGQLQFPLKESLAMGTFSLSELASAFEKAEPTNKNADNSTVYHVIQNNCASLMLHLGAELGVKMDARVTSFVARRLLEHSGSILVDKIRSSVNYYRTLFPRDGDDDDKANNRRLVGGSWAGERTRRTDEEVVNRLVDASYAAQLYRH